MLGEENVVPNSIKILEIMHFIQEKSILRTISTRNKEKLLTGNNVFVQNW
mgnify:CR=1 FL=1